MGTISIEVNNTNTDGTATSVSKEQTKDLVIRAAVVTYLSGTLPADRECQCLCEIYVSPSDSLPIIEGDFTQEHPPKRVLPQPLSLWVYNVKATIRSIVAVKLRFTVIVN